MVSHLLEKISVVYKTMLSLNSVLDGCNLDLFIHSQEIIMET